MYKKIVIAAFCLSLALVVNASKAAAQNEKSCRQMGNRLVKYCHLQAGKRGSVESFLHRRQVRDAFLLKRCAQVSRQFERQCNLSPQADCVCIMSFDPVCAIRTGSLVLKTYSNNCQALNDGAFALYRGNCR